ncbi:Uncharacterized protein FKW44_000822 [Caligus rogercresseyi]|uniref:Uncharacterized protein n=1 Tax=Caligus rogercresseyi TaxID=217165 RepID=A0A7T8KHV7_CALRO|nr:Uncharacterized protein FKW44_000822 [Caligus rogercresseyi]
MNSLMESLSASSKTELRPILQRFCRTDVQPIFTTFGARSFDLPHLLIATPLTLPSRGW